MEADEARVLERYDRQLRIEGWDQEKLMKSSVVVVGVGATGCELSKNLALMGVGKLMLIDNDVVELSNLSRQMLFTDDDLGKPKAVIAAEKLKKMNRMRNPRITRMKSLRSQKSRKQNPPLPSRRCLYLPESLSA